MKPLPYILLLALCGCVVSKPENGNLKPEVSLMPIQSKMVESLIDEPPPQPIPLVINGPELPCTNCYVQLQESADLKNWQTRPEIYYAGDVRTNWTENVGLTNALGFFRFVQVETNL